MIVRDSREKRISKRIRFFLSLEKKRKKEIADQCKRRNDQVSFPDHRKHFLFNVAFGSSRNIPIKLPRRDDYVVT